MRYFVQDIQQFIQKENGATSIEYVLIASLIAVVILGAVSVLGTQVCASFNLVASGLGASGISCT